MRQPNDPWSEPVDECIAAFEAQIRREGVDVELSPMGLLRAHRVYGSPFAELAAMNISPWTPWSAPPSMMRPLLTYYAESPSGLIDFELRCSCGRELRGSFIHDAVIDCPGCGTPYDSRTLNQIGYLDDHR